MSTDQVHLERRASQRFDFQLPVGIRLAGTEREGCGFTQDLSGRGAFFYTDFQVAEGDAVELTFMMPAEITLTENMRVRCRGRVTRVLPAQSKFGVAVHLEGYEYLSEAESAAQVSASFPRVSGAHDANQTRKNLPSPQLLPRSRWKARIAVLPKGFPVARKGCGARFFHGFYSFPIRSFLHKMLVTDGRVASDSSLHLSPSDH